MKKVRLGDICTIVSGTTPKSNVEEYWGGHNIWITPAELSANSFVINDSERHITDLAVSKSGLKPFPKGTVILSSRAPIGKTAIAGCEMYCNQGFKNLICSDEINNVYLYYFLKSKTQYLNSLGRGATFKEISKSLVENIEIPLPGMEQQVKIGNTLRAIEELLEKRNSQLSLFDELIKSRFVEMFGDPIENNKKWPLLKLSQLGTLERGRSKHRPRNDPELLGGPYPLVQTGEVTSANLFIKNTTQSYSELGLRQSKLWKKGTLCITIAANIAQTAILYFDACFPDSVVGFIPNKSINVIFLHYWFQYLQKIIEFRATQVAQKNINLKILSSLNVIVPTISIQNQFAAFVQQVDKSRLAVQKSLDELETLKKSLMQEYFG